MSDLDLTENKDSDEQKESPEEQKSEVSSDNNSKKRTSLKEKVSNLKVSFKAFFANPKKRLIFLICSGIILIIIVALGVYAMSREEDGILKGEEYTERDPECPNVLDGVMTDCETATRHPLAITVENHTRSRPQSGLDKASIVYEAVTEGGITRFLALYSREEAEKVGPVRSARTYFVDWSHGYDAYLAHVGGNMDALDQIQAVNILDLDQFKYPSSYWREKQAGLASEHTMYTSTVKLRKQAKENNYVDTNNFNIYRFKDGLKEKTAGEESKEEGVSDQDTTSSAENTIEEVLPESQKIIVEFSTRKYNVYFDYNKDTNSYKRFMGGSAHKDKVTKEQIDAKNIIVMYVKKNSTMTRINEPGYNMDTQGSGDAKIFFDGKTIEGTWKKPTSTDRELFYDKDGNEITFNRGKFWICVISPGDTVTVE